VEDAWRSNAVRPLELLVELKTAAYSPVTWRRSGCCEGLLTSHVDVCGVAENTPRTSGAEREAATANAVGSVGVENLLVVYAGSRFCIYAAVLRGDRPHKNYQATCDTFLCCILRKFWGGVSCLCLV
jgi:hypothetical protein